MRIVAREIRYCLYHILYYVVGGAALAISIVAFPFISPAFRRVCLPYVPASNQQIFNVFHALEGRRGSLIDIGSGDGKIVRWH